MITNKAGGRDEPEHQFKEIARAALERSATRRAAEVKKVEHAKLEHERRFAAAVDALKLSVIPLLERAKLAFESEGVPVEILTNFAEAGAPQAHVVFECCGRFWSNAHGEVELAASDRAVFFHDGTDFHVGIAKSFSKRPDSRSRVDDDIAPRVLAAVEVVVDSFFQDVERRCRYCNSAQRC